LSIDLGDEMLDGGAGRLFFVSFVRWSGSDEECDLISGMMVLLDWLRPLM
jgi:hypothetical protein